MLVRSTTTRTLVTTYSGRLLVMPQHKVKRLEAGGTTRAVSGYDVTLPVDTDVQRGDIVTVTRARYDGALVGIPLTIVDAPLDPWQIARYAVAERFT